MSKTARQPGDISYRLLDPEVIENPYPFYRTLLEQAPVYRIPGTQVYYVASWRLIHEVLKNQQDYSANLTGILITGDSGEPELFDLSQFGGTVDAIANADEPVHAIHRKLVLPQLNARTVAGMESEVRDWTRARVEALVQEGGGDCVAALANDIPVMVMARLVGLPIEDVPQLLQWAFSGGDILAGTLGLEQMIELGLATREMSAYLAGHLRAALANAADRPADCVADELARGIREGLIDEREAVAIMVVLVGAAGESTSSLVGSAIRLLAQDECLQARLRQDPALIAAFVEEVVRLESPFKGHYRVVLNDTELGGVKLQAGARVFLLWAAANRDPQVFAQPDELQLNRPEASEHLGFGYGIHFCIGARLARMEAGIILEELLARTDSFVITQDHQPQHVPSIFVRRLSRLQLEVEGKARS